VHMPCKTPKQLPCCRMSYLQLALSPHHIQPYMTNLKLLDL
jgi:hypothetical protein